MEIKVGLIGFGTVGAGVAKALYDNAPVIKARLGCDVVLKKIADKDITSKRCVPVPAGVLTTDVDSIINDHDISIVVELIGGIDAAKNIILKSLKNGKHVVTANKALLSTHGKELFTLAKEKNLSLGFEASVAGGIPIIKSIKEGLSANNINSIYGIINGTANYILSKMTNEGGKFDEVLKEAQAKGYAEKDPAYDVEGIDTAHKLAILINLAYGAYCNLSDIYTEGITKISPIDVAFAREFGYKIKLLAIAKSSGDSVEARVHPTMIPFSHPLSSVDGIFNAVHIVGDVVGPVMFYGKGAGMMPTASAVVADIMDVCRDLKKGCVTRLAPLSYSDGAIKDIKIKNIDELECAYYLRFTVADKPGVLSDISGALGAHNISIASVIQKGRAAEGGVVPLVIITHGAKERELKKALSGISKIQAVTDKIMYVRIEESGSGT
ncbi:MAG: homoserine dehydrogenase [Thermodesulfobacteriota bacterium]